MRAGWSGPARVLDGKACAADVKNDVRERLNVLRERGIEPVLGTILVGDDPGSQVYVRGKHQDCAEVGMRSVRIDLPADASEDRILEAVHQLNQDPDCYGYIVQLPLPRGVDTRRVIAAIDPAKDADGLHPMNLGRLVSTTDGPLDVPTPCTPRACLTLLEWAGIPIRGANVCMVGNGLTVGRTFGVLASRRQVHATVTTCHSATKDLAAHTRSADIIIAATGIPGMITAEMVSPGATVLDVGVSRVVDPDTGKARLYGDVADGVDQVAGWLTPNPGGVGPMTRALLLVNVVEAAERSAGV